MVSKRPSRRLSLGTLWVAWSTYPRPKRTGNSNQQARHIGGGYYSITSRTGSLVVDLTNGHTSDRTPIRQWAGSSGNQNQGWQFVPNR